MLPATFGLIEGVVGALSSKSSSQPPGTVVEMDTGCTGTAATGGGAGDSMLLCGGWGEGVTNKGAWGERPPKSVGGDAGVLDLEAGVGDKTRLGAGDGSRLS